MADKGTNVELLSEESKEQALLRNILLDNLPCIALILKKETREIVASNKAAKEVGAVPGKTCYQTCADRADNCPFCLAPELWMTNEPQRLEIEYRDKYYEGRWIPFSEDLYVHYIFDITDHKKNEKELEEKIEELERFQKLTVGRELRMIEMKKQMNAMSKELGKPEPFS